MRKLIVFASVAAFNTILVAIVMLLCNMIYAFDVHILEKIVLVATYSSMFTEVVAFAVVIDNDLWRFFLKIAKHFKFIA